MRLVKVLMPEISGVLPDTMVYGSNWYTGAELADHLSITAEQLIEFFKVFHDNRTYFGYRCKFRK